MNSSNSKFLNWSAVSAAFLLNGALLGIWASRIPNISEKLELSEGQLALPLLMMAAGAVASFQIAGRLSDWLGAKRTTLAISIVYTLALLPMSLAPSGLMLGVALFVFGATHGAMDVAMNTWASKVDERLETAFMPSFHAMFSVGLGLGALSGFFAAQLSWEPTLHFAVAGLGLFSLWLICSRVPWQDTRAAHNPDDPVIAFPKGPLILVGVLAGCAAIGEGAMADWSAIFLNRTLELDEGRAALGLVAFNVGMVSVRFAGAWLIDNIGKVRVTRISGITACLGALMLVLSPLTAFGFPLSLVGFLLIGLGLALIFPLAFSRAASEPNGKPGANIAAVATLGYGGLLLGPVFVGFLAQAITLQWALGTLVLTSASIALLANTLRVK